MTLFRVLMHLVVIILCHALEERSGMSGDQVFSILSDRINNNMDIIAMDIYDLKDEMKTNIAFVNKRLDTIELQLQSNNAIPDDTEKGNMKFTDVRMIKAIAAEKLFVRNILTGYEGKFNVLQNSLRDQVSSLNKQFETINENLKTDQADHTLAVNKKMNLLNDNIEISKIIADKQIQEKMLFINNSLEEIKLKSEKRFDDVFLKCKTSLDNHVTEHNSLHQLINQKDSNVLRTIERFERQLNHTMDTMKTIETKMIDGGFSFWTKWSECSKTCGTGTQTRTRTCTHSSLQGREKDCSGASIESQNCHGQPCPIDGGFSDWTTWGECSKQCGEGTHIRTRTCTNPSPQYNGVDCSGETIDTASCDGTECFPADCSDVNLHNPDAPDGVYEVVLWNTSRTIQVYCDMTTDGGGWTVFQNRYDGSVNFYRNYSQYEHGFGDFSTEFWLGLDYIQEMTSHPEYEYELRIDLMAADETAYEVISPFSLSAPNYVLNVGSTTSSYNIDAFYIWEQFIEHNGKAFSTYDHDVDYSTSRNCAKEFRGGWWFGHCFWTNLNGEYITPGRSSFIGINYSSFKGVYSMKQTRMSFRKT